MVGITSIKKAVIINCIQLGMEKYKAYLLAELTEEEIEKIDEDKDFQNELEIISIIKEKHLLEKYEEIIDISVSRGNANPIQWLLGKLNKRWSSNDSNLDNNKLNKTIVYLPENGR